MFHNLTIRNKMLVAFALVLCCTLAVCLFARDRLARVIGAASATWERSLPEIEALSELEYQSTRFRQFEAMHLLARNGADRANEAAKLGRTLAAINAAFVASQNLVSSDDDRRQAEAVAQLWHKYLAMHVALLALSDKGDRDGAITLMSDGTRVLFNQFHDTLQAEKSLIVNESRQSASTGLALGRSANMGILAALALAAAMCALATWIMVRSVSRPVAGMTAMMRGLAARDLGFAIPFVGRRDEIGAMAQRHPIPLVQDRKQCLGALCALCGESSLSRADDSSQQAKPIFVSFVSSW